MPNDFTARSWPAACPLAVSPPLSSILSLLLSLACFTHSQTAPYTLIYARTSCQNVFCCPRLQRFQFALTSRSGSQTLLPACQSVWPGLACSAVCLLEPITSAACLPAAFTIFLCFWGKPFCCRSATSGRSWHPVLPLSRPSIAARHSVDLILLALFVGVASAQFRM